MRTRASKFSGGIPISLVILGLIEIFELGFKGVAEYQNVQSNERKQMYYDTSLYSSLCDSRVHLAY
jgi:hypothetical protein